MDREFTTIQQDRRMEFMDIIEKRGSIGKSKLQDLLGWGDGIFERTKRDVLELHSEDIIYNKRTKLFTTIVNVELFRGVKI